MQTRTAWIKKLTREEVFYLEQWVALAVGTLLLAVAIWGTMHLLSFPPLTHSASAHITTDRHLCWALIAVSDVIAFALFYFAFRVRFRELKSQQKANKPGVQPASVPAHRSRLAGNTGGK